MPRLPRLVAAMAALSCTTAHSQETPTDKTTLISRQPFEVKIMDDGRDFTAITPAAFVKYNIDGSDSGLGCIDVGRAGEADRYQDLAIMWQNLGEFSSRLQERFLQSYGIAKLDRRKLDFHLMLDELF